MKETLVIIPAYNEDAVIASVIRNVQRNAPDCDIVVIDDGSTDNTVTVARETDINVLSLPFNMGYGVALQTGYKYAFEKGYESLVQIDGDGQHDPAYISDLLSSLRSGDADVIIGSRFLGTESYRPPFVRKIGMAFFKKAVSFILGQKVTDATSGFQAFNKNVISFLIEDIFPCDYPDADILIALHLAGFRIKELSVRMFSNVNGKSMHSGMKPVYYIFKMLLSIFVTLLRSRRLYRRSI